MLDALRKCGKQLVYMGEENRSKDTGGGKRLASS